MSKTFREFHLFKALNSFDLKATPLDVHLNKYYRTNRSIGSKDRKYISENIYQIVRWMGLIDHYCKESKDWEERFRTFKELNIKKRLKDVELPLHIRASFPKDFFNYLLKDYGEKQALKLCHTCNASAPTTVRTNVLKTTRRDLFNKLNSRYKVTLTKNSPFGITFEERINFHLLEEFKNGHFEIQDEASQLIANLVDAAPGDQVLDYCAGSGGKTLGFAHKMQGRGKIFLHDIRTRPLREAEKRIKRAGVEKTHVLPYDSEEKPKLKGKMDWVLVDVPCSGSGTLRRNPDLKWKFSPENLNQLVEKQRNIFEEALQYLKPSGKIVYATCSILHEENEEQVIYFQENFHLDLASKPFKSLPIEGGMDGFFGAVLQKLD